MTGTKDDQEKTRLDLIPGEALEMIGQAFTHGASKYDDHNWRGGIKYSRLYGATLRHLFAYWGGGETDKDSGLSHLSLAGAELCMLMAMDKEYDDRYSSNFTINKDLIKDEWEAFWQVDIIIK